MNRILLIGSLAALLVGTTGCLHHNTRKSDCKTCSTGNGGNGTCNTGECGNNNCQSGPLRLRQRWQVRRRRL